MAFKVCTALDLDGIKAVLTGGSAATVYAPEAYQSRDADFIASWVTKEREFQETMRMLGFTKTGRIYSHPACLFTLDFPDDEIRIGETFVREHDTLTDGDLHLHLLKPAHCVCDRLASFFWYQDRSALKAAVAVAVNTGVALHEVEAWAQEHREEAKFKEFRERVFVALERKERIDRSAPS